MKCTHPCALVLVLCFLMRKIEFFYFEGLSLMTKVADQFGLLLEGA
jgi:hypothetical protein